VSSGPENPPVLAQEAQGQRPAIVELVKPVIVLNGDSSSGKTSLARRLQRLLGPTWMTLGVDDLARALPGGDEIDDLIGAQQDGDEPAGTDGSIEFGPDGSVTVGDDFRRAEASWHAGLAAIGRCGTGLIVDEVFLGGGSPQERLASTLAGLPVVCLGSVATPRSPSLASAAGQTGLAEWLVNKPRGYTRASPTTWSWTPPPPAPPTVHGPSLLTCQPSRTDG
jgi:chloramphenicol 3-O phosphotransferase